MSSSKKTELTVVKKFICGMVILAGLLSACAVVTGVYLVADFMSYVHREGGGLSGTSAPWEKIVVLPAGQGFSGVTKDLVDVGVVADPLRFKLLARILGYDRRIKAGEYLFSSAMSPVDILNKLARGKVVLHGLTIPEGYNLREIAALVGQKGIGDKEAFLAKVQAPEYAAGKGIEGKTLEGYLFPDTYYFPRNTEIDRIIQAMLDRFNDVYTPSWAARARRMNLTRHQVVTLASIIEKETGTAEERPVVSSVFHNRLARGMKLQTDPTVIYGIEDFDGNLTRKHLATPTPYNTYQIAGLPPGPIASPGKASLEAVLFPEETDFLYFVARGDGTHQFSATLDDHNEAVRRYQLGGKDTGENSR